MPKLKITFLTALLAFGTVTDIAAAQSFSADILTIGTAGRPTGQTDKLYVGATKVRIEAPEVSDGFFLVDTAAQSSYLVRPARKIFMDAKQSTPLTQILVHIDPMDPCAQWQAMAKIAGATDNGGAWQCERLGEETLDGRATMKYRTTSARGQVSLAWIDVKLKFLVRTRKADGSGIDLTAIKEGPQDERLFNFPANYGKFDPKQLIERIKQSDVWVAPPH